MSVVDDNRHWAIYNVLGLRVEMITELRLRRLHRFAGIVLAPLVLVQAWSGMVISFEVLLGIHKNAADVLRKQEALALQHAWEYLLLDIHYGGGYWGNLYHLVIVSGLMWLILSGVLIFIKIAKRERQRRPKPSPT